MKLNYEPLGKHIRLVDYRNSEEITSTVLGISIDKEFMPSVANVIGTDLSRYKLISKGLFACNPMHVGRDERLPIALYEKDNAAIVSPAYFMFEIIDRDVLNEEYLMMWFRRPEFDRECWFMTDGSVRGGITWDDLCRIKLPVPSYARQCEIVESYRAITNRIALKRAENDNLEATIQAAFDKAFHDAGVSLPETIIKQNKVPQGWTDATVGDFASVQTGPFGSQLHNEDYVESGTPIITVEHMDGKYIAHRNLPLVSQNDVDRLRKYDLHTGDIVFSRVGSVDRAVMVSQHEDGWLFSGRCLRVRPYDPNTGSYFLWWFNQPVIRQLVTASAVGATMPSINTSILNSIRIVFPQKDIVTQFCKMADGLIEIIATNLEEIRKLNDAREYIQLSLSR
ncbi:restriction endonuclease subunit S [Clostridium sp. AF12-19]|nr:MULTISPECIES: restriction endonuclease subunit S [unclassified Clostridium]RHS24453.1 restriction endonuclease subunit S [Clostridium sp. AF12-28]RHS30279.1 restriction endonuclease subunit S [Clostridium sp. AF12-19]